MLSLIHIWKLGKLLVTGCLSQRYQDELMEELPEVDEMCIRDRQPVGQRRQARRLGQAH